MTGQHISKLSLFFIALDVVALLFSSFSMHYVYLGSVSLTPEYQQALLLSIILFLWTSSATGVYQSWRGKSFFSEFKPLFISIVLVFAILVFLWFTLKIGSSYSRAWLLLWFFFAIFLLFVFRFLARSMLHILYRKGVGSKNIVLIGSGGWVDEVKNTIDSHSELGLVVIKSFKDAKSAVEFLESNSGNHINKIWMAMPIGEEMKATLNDLSNVTTDIFWLPDTSSFYLINHSVSYVKDMPVLSLSSNPIVGVKALMKWVEDKILSFIILIFISPIMIFIALGVKLTSRGDIFYRQERVGWNGKKFNMLKFRSMASDAEKNTGAVWAAKNDSRVTKFGAFLRKTSLDELPQFLNVLKGDMSIVGPRPEREVFVDKFKDEIPGYMRKHMVKAGITGLAQVKGLRGNTDLNRRIKYDLIYINNWSLFLDIKIIFLTALKVFIDKNAY
jgi:putative colanic acid biosynthesis UDP-glucose lipid carrier transferase